MKTINLEITELQKENLLQMAKDLIPECFTTSNKSSIYEDYFVHLNTDNGVNSIASFKMHWRDLLLNKLSDKLFNKIFKYKNIDVIDQQLEESIKDIWKSNIELSIKLYLEKQSNGKSEAGELIIAHPIDYLYSKYKRVFHKKTKKAILNEEILSESNHFFMHT